MIRHICMTTLLLAGSAQALAGEAGDYQLQRLLSPTPEQEKAERAGKVMIYDSLTQAQVNRAMDNQFPRIGSMMFVRTRYIDESGNEAVEEDDCDD